MSKRLELIAELERVRKDLAGIGERYDLTNGEFCFCTDRTAEAYELIVLDIEYLKTLKEEEEK